MVAVTDTTEGFTGALADSVQFDVNYDANVILIDRPITLLPSLRMAGTRKTDTETWTLTTVAG